MGWGNRRRVALCAASILVTGACAWRMLGVGPGVPFASRVLMVDVVTGEVFEFRVGGGRAVSIPARHPRTRARSLIPVYEEDGEWWIGKRGLASLATLPVSPDAIDPTTGRVRVARTTPRIAAAAGEP